MELRDWWLAKVGAVEGALEQRLPAALAMEIAELCGALVLHGGSSEEVRAAIDALGRAETAAFARNFEDAGKELETALPCVRALSRGARRTAMEGER